MTSSTLAISAVWLVLGLVIFITNAVTTVFMWKTKTARQKAQFGLHPHGIRNLLTMELAFTFSGFILTVNCVTWLIVDGNFTKEAADSFGFLMQFSSNFAVMSILVNIIDKFYCFWKPLRYHVYIHSASNIPLLAFTCCVINGLLHAILLLVNFSKHKLCLDTYHAPCFRNLDNTLTTRLVAFLDLVITLVLFGFILVVVLLRRKLVQNRKKMKVASTRPTETIIFSLLLSSLFLISWLPNWFAMVIVTVTSDVNAPVVIKGKPWLDGIALVPLILNPFITYGLHGYFRKELKEGMSAVRKRLPLKIKDNIQRRPSVIDIEMAQANQVPV